MTSGGAGVLRYLTSRKVPFPRFVILANKKGTIYGNRLPSGTQVKKGCEPLS